MSSLHSPDKKQDTHGSKVLEDCFVINENDNNGDADEVEENCDEIREDKKIKLSQIKKDYKKIKCINYHLIKYTRFADRLTKSTHRDRIMKKIKVLKLQKDNLHEKIEVIKKQQSESIAMKLNRRIMESTEINNDFSTEVEILEYFSSDFETREKDLPEITLIDKLPKTKKFPFPILELKKFRFDENNETSSSDYRVIFNNFSFHLSDYFSNSCISIRKIDGKIISSSFNDNLLMICATEAPVNDNIFNFDKVEGNLYFLDIKLKTVNKISLEEGVVSELELFYVDKELRALFLYKTGQLVEYQITQEYSLVEIWRSEILFITTFSYKNNYLIFTDGNRIYTKQNKTDNFVYPVISLTIGVLNHKVEFYVLLSNGYLLGLNESLSNLRFIRSVKGASKICYNSDIRAVSIYELDWLFIQNIYTLGTKEESLKRISVWIEKFYDGSILVNRDYAGRDKQNFLLQIFMEDDRTIKVLTEEVESNRCLHIILTCISKDNLIVVTETGFVLTSKLEINRHVSIV